MLLMLHLRLVEAMEHLQSTPLEMVLMFSILF